MHKAHIQAEIKTNTGFWSFWEQFGNNSRIFLGFLSVYLANISLVNWYNIVASQNDTNSTISSLD